MKKTFDLTHPKIKYPRLIEGAKNNVRKYFKRERRKTLPEGYDIWVFNCKFGESQDTAEDAQESELMKRIDEIEAKALTSFYVEIISKPGNRTLRPQPGDS